MTSRYALLKYAPLRARAHGVRPYRLRCAHTVRFRVLAVSESLHIPASKQSRMSRNPRSHADRRPQMSRNPRYVAFRPRRLQQIGGRATCRAEFYGGVRFAFHRTPGHELARNRSCGPVREKCRATPDLLHQYGTNCNRSGVARHIPRCQQRDNGLRPRCPGQATNAFCPARILPRTRHAPYGGQNGPLVSFGTIVIIIDFTVG